MKVDNLRLIEALVPFERDCVDAEGRTAVDYAKIGGRGEEVIQILLWKEYSEIKINRNSFWIKIVNTTK